MFDLIPKLDETGSSIDKFVDKHFQDRYEKDIIERNETPKFDYVLGIINGNSIQLKNKE